MKINKEDNYIYGRNPVKEALIHKQVKYIFITQSFDDKNLLELININKISYQTVSKIELDKTTNNANHQGILAICKPYTYASLEEIISLSKKQSHPIILILDGIEDPHNLGAILRCGDVFNVAGVIIPKHGSVTLNPTVAKTSAGAINYVKVAIVANLNQAIETLKNNGFWIVSSDGSATKSYLDLKYDFPTVLVIGSEGNGVSKLVLKNSDYIVKIPQYGKVNSLNASVAAGILLAKIRS